MKNVTDLYDIIKDRLRNKPQGSYVASIASGGKNRLVKKIGEEIIELSMEVGKKDLDKESIIYEATDVFFHMWILLGFLEITPNEIMNELEKRHKRKCMNIKDKEV